MNELKRNWVDQKALAYSPKKKTKKEQDRENILYHSLNFEKERERTRFEYHTKHILFKHIFLKFLLFLNYNLNNWQTIYIYI